jgi:DNA-directed RNA polymerase subunit RPC12/RpoP
MVTQTDRLDVGYICKSCGKLNQYFDLDLEMGKTRKEYECERCGTVTKHGDLDKALAESQVVKFLKQKIDSLEGVLQDVDDAHAQKEVSGRLNQLIEMAEVLQVKDSLSNSELIRKCMYCTTANAVGSDRCDACGASDWMPEKIKS